MCPVPASTVHAPSSSCLLTEFGLIPDSSFRVTPSGMPDRDSMMSSLSLSQQLESLNQFPKSHPSSSIAVSSLLIFPLKAPQKLLGSLCSHEFDFSQETI